MSLSDYLHSLYISDGFVKSAEDIINAVGLAG